MVHKGQVHISTQGGEHQELEVKAKTKYVIIAFDLS
jgi:hypothetical protein